ncbi:MAG: metallophosphoesterase [Candidatus Thermoplasmatota archaeon]|nr:metallophosphoesterase [Candidatus Thermoplasmatota archaeon]
MQKDLWTKALVFGMIILFFGTGTILRFETPVQANPAEELVAYWSFDEGSGTIAHDSVGSNDGQIYGNPVWVGGVSGTAIDFDGSNDYVLVDDNDVLDLDYTDFTVSFWCKPKASGYQMDAFFKGYPGVNHDGSWAIRNSESENTWVFQNLDTTNDHPGYNPTPCPLNEWTMITMTYDDSTGAFKTYINDELDFNTIYKMELRDTARDLYLGSVTGTHAFFKGLLDEMRIYQRVLSTDEVASLYSLDAPSSTHNQLSAYWSFDEGTGNTFFDSSENGNDGTTHGATWTTGVSGYALSFDGINDYADVPDSQSLDITGDLTLSAWVYCDSMPNTAPIISKGNYGTNFGYYLATGQAFSDGCANMQLASTDATLINLNGKTPLQIGQWHFLTAVRNDNIAKIYIDGEYENSITCFSDDIRTNNLPLEFGTHWEGKLLFHGKIDEVRIYNYALSSNEIENLYLGIEEETPEEPSSEFYFIQITDLHIGAEKAIERFNKCLNHISKFNPKPAFILITGDIVDIATEENYESFIDSIFKDDNGNLFLDDTQKIPIYTCPGNHDYRDIGLLGNYYQYVNESSDYSFFNQDANCYFFSLNSGHDVIGSDWFPPYGSGLTSSQISWLEHELDMLDGRDDGEDSGGFKKVIFMHHPAINELNWYGIYEEGTIYNNKQLFIDYCTNFNVDLVLCGHTHNNCIFDKNKQEILDGAIDGTAFVQTASCWEECAYRNITIDENSINIHPPECFYSVCTVVLECPADLYLVDSNGNEVSAEKSELIDAFYYNTTYGNHSRKLVSFSLGEKDYQVKIKGENTGSFNLTIKKSLESGNFSMASYQNISINNKSEASIDIKEEVISYKLKIDNNGDGTIDEYIEPTATYGISEPSSSQDNEGKTPGFELLFVLCAIALAMLLWRKR